ncbi:hypothetical protein Cantr_04074 [Candida viswanathii]|uniref:Protein BOP3 n=1 Tax=Candida viswanathii TaxID=5486 RepID=A0A367XNQ3_9ASCO|nr:hypothetical protein Cantr_04074 [Candida viswanathii]
MSSMSVNSLIDKNIEEEQHLQQQKQQSQQQQPSIPQKRPSSTNVEELQPPFQGQNRASPTATTAIPSLRRLSESISHPPQLQEPYRSPQKPISDPGLLSLLGPNVTSFPFSDDSFQDALKLRAEQERTKQEYYRVETANKNLAILQTALRAQIPIHLIPLMCVGKMPELTEEQMKAMIQQPLPQPPPGPQFQPQAQQVPPPPPHQQQQQPQQYPPVVQQQGPPVFMQPGLLQEQQIQIIQANQKRMQQELQQQGGAMPQTSPFQKAHRRSNSSGGSGSGPVTQQDAFNVAGGPPLGFRFGAGSSSGRRPLSPAKIGAAAVANLATPTTPYRGYASASSSAARKLPSHQRHSSLPVETPNRQHVIDLSAADPNKGAQSLQSPLVGTTSTLQVKPIPAQPLHKQNKLQVQPLQESMTSFQHVIQFHHWKPTTTLLGPTSTSGSPVRTLSHKRRKSSVATTPILESSPISSLKSRPEEPAKEQPKEQDPEPELASSTPKPSTSESAHKDDVDMEPDMSMDSSVSDTTALKVEEEANPPRAHRRNRLTFARKNA